MKPDAQTPWSLNFAVFRHHCGFFELKNWASVTITGADRQTFLNSFCTNDVKRLTPGSSCEAFFCNVKGKIIGHGLVTCRDEELVVIGPPGQAAPLVAHLDRYIIREDVAIRDTTAERSYILLAGGGGTRGIFISLAPSAEIGKTWLEPLQNAAGILIDVPVRLIRWSLLGQIFCGLLEFKPTEAASVQRVLRERSAEPRDRAVFDALRIEAGMPFFGIDFDARSFPQEVGRNEQAISFTKGCYLGQETVARIDAMGHVNQQLVGVAFSEADVPPVGIELSIGETNVGRVTSATFSPALGQPLALAMVRRDKRAIGTQLSSPAGQCAVVALPLTSPREAI